MTAAAARASAPGMDLPHLIVPRSLRPPPDLFGMSQGHSSDRSENGEEFDFSDVFGPVQPHNQLTNGHLASVAENEPVAEHMASWAPPESISEGEPLIMVHRSHSLVGPALTPRQSFSCLSGRFSVGESPAEASAITFVETELKQATKGTKGNGAGVAEMDGEHVEAVVVSTAAMHAMGLSDSSGESSGDEATPGKRRLRNEQLAKVQGSVEVASAERLGPNDFELLRVVGQGAFGKVFQVKKKDTGEIMAMKVMRKDKIVEKNHGDYMKAERDILKKAIHPFIVQLQYSFQTRTKLYLLLDFINGGHLFFQLYRQGTFSEELAKIYSAEIVLAVAHLHKMGIMHRDLKPENILLDSDGHVKLTDFGLAKEVRENDKSNSLCGTMEYMAPEIILAKGHGCAADWWSVGILLFEMLTGQPPFFHKNRQKLQQKITKDKVKLPQWLSPEANNLLKGLLQKDPARRLGSGPNGIDEIIKHKWFKGIDWKKLERREIQPKFRPTVHGKHCTANFDEVWTSMPVLDSPIGTPNSDGIDLLNLRGYTYSAPRVWLPTVESDSQADLEDCEDDLDDEEASAA